MGKNSTIVVYLFTELLKNIAAAFLSALTVGSVFVRFFSWIKYEKRAVSFDAWHGKCVAVFLLYYVALCFVRCIDLQRCALLGV